MAFYNPYEKKMSGATVAGGITDLLNQLLMYKMIMQMYPGKKKEREQVVPGELPPQRLIGSEIQGMAPGPGQMQGGQTPDINQLMQMLQMLGMSGGF